MQPLGRKKVKFPGKTKEWLGKGVRMWWENLTNGNKRSERQQSKLAIKKEQP